jgi:hypothetical protein
MMCQMLCEFDRLSRFFPKLQFCYIAALTASMWELIEWKSKISAYCFIVHLVLM